MSESFHNTTHARGTELERYEAKAWRQDDQVLKLFAKYSPFGLTPSQAHRALGTRAPLTSIRRAISNLTARGALVKTIEQVSGPFGRPEYRWKLKREPQQVRLPI